MANLLFDPSRFYANWFKGPGDALDAIGTYSSAPADWVLKHDETGWEPYHLVIHKLMVLIVFDKKTDVRYYGPLATPGLANGLTVSHYKAATGSSVNLTRHVPIKNHVDMALYTVRAGSTQFNPEDPQGNQEGYIVGLLGTPETDYGFLLQRGDELRIRVQDDFTAQGGFTAHRFGVHGQYIDKATPRQIGAGGGFLM